MRIVMIVFLALLSAGTFAQTADQKFGYANFEGIFTQMPEEKQVENAIKVHGDQLKAQLDAKYKEYQAKVEVYKKLPATTPDAIRADKESELTQLQQNIQKFQQDAQESLQKKQNDLMEPVFAKISKALDAVAKENGYTYIFTSKTLTGENVVLYADEKYDISTLVLKKLGITPPVAAATK